MPSSSDYLSPDFPALVSDDLLQQRTVITPAGGLLEGIDPANIVYEMRFSPDIENIRVASGQWATRLGQQLYLPIGGSGNVRLLADLYQTSGTIVRLAAQGTGTAGQLYEYTVGVSGSFSAASGGGSLGSATQPYWQGVTLNDRFYFTDRNTGLLRYNPSGSPNHVALVTQPAAPTAAAGAVPRYFAKLDDWASGWTDSNAADFADVDDTTNQPAPGGGNTRKLEVLNTSAKTQTITRPTGYAPLFTGDVGLGSHQVAFWVRQDQFKTMLQFQMGNTTPQDYNQTLAADSQNTNTWYPFFMDIGDLASANYIRFQCLDVSPGGSANVWVSSLYLPGTLDGPYRWVYTNYDSSGGRESPPSAITNNGNALDFSTTGTPFDPTTARAFTKCCALNFTSDSGTDSSTDRIRVYRNGGVPSLTTDANGLDLWLRVADIPDFSTTFSQTDNAGSTLLHLANVPNTLQKGMWLVLDKGVVGKEEYVQISGVTVGTPGTVNIARGLGTGGTTQYTHSLGAAIQIAYVDNTANETIQLTETLDAERAGPPSAAQFVARAEDGRLWLFKYSGVPTGIQVSNRPTPDRPTDFECFPGSFTTPVGSGVFPSVAPPDPETRASLTQGWGIEVLGNLAQDEQIEWGGFFNGWATVLTRGNLYVITARSQAEYGPSSIQKLHRVGALAGTGDCVREVDGVLYWVAPGPSVMRWDGRGAPENISHLRVNVRLKAAPAANWSQWFAITPRIQDGRYYSLYIVPSGQTNPTMRLDYNIDQDAWEPVVYYTMAGSAIGYQAALVNLGLADTDQIYQVDTSGNIWQAETGNLDGGAPISIRWATPKIALVRSHPYWLRQLDTALAKQLLFRLAGVTDTVSVTVTVGGSEYGTVSHSYTVSLAGTGDDEFRQLLHRDLLGRHCQVQVSGLVSNSPAFRTLTLDYLPLGPTHISG